ncbi:hypothetical protein ACFE04_000372 [Oxalis oulophora]
MASVTGFRDTTWCMASLRSSLPKASPFNHSSIRFQLTRRNSNVSFTRQTKPSQVLATACSSLAPHSLGFSDSTCFGGYTQLPSITNGSRFFAMRHGRRVPKLNRPPDQRKALIRGLTTQLLKHGRIKTTKTRASAIRKYVDKMITLAKDGSLHKRRQALGFIYEKQIVHALFAEVPDRYGERNGGYTRIIRTLPRRGDNAPMAYIELV